MPIRFLEDTSSTKRARVRFLDDSPPEESPTTSSADGSTSGGSLAEKASAFLRRAFQRPFGREAVSAAVSPITRPLTAGAKVVAQNPEGALEALPAIAGTAAGVATGGMGAIPAVLAAGGAGAAGELAKQEARKRLLGLNPVSPRRPTIPFTSKPIPDIPGIPVRASRAVIEGGLQAGPELIGRGVGNLLSRTGETAEEAGVSAARRTQGFQKSQLSSSKSWSESLRKQAQANRAAKTALDRGDIPLLGGAETMQDNAQRLLQEGSQKVRGALSAVRDSGKTLSLETVDDVILKTLNPKNEDELAAALKIERALKDASQKGSLSVDALNELRQSFGQSGFRDKTVGSAAADMYRAAWKATGLQLKRLLGDADPRYARMYAEGLKQEEMANTSLGAIVNRLAKEQGNEFISLPSLGTQAVRRAMAPLSVGLYRGGQAAQMAAPVAGRGTQGFLSGLSVAARRKLEEMNRRKK